MKLVKWVRLTDKKYWVAFWKDLQPYEYSWGLQGCQSLKERFRDTLYKKRFTGYHWGNSVPFLHFLPYQLEDDRRTLSLPIHNPVKHFGLELAFT